MIHAYVNITAHKPLISNKTLAVNKRSCILSVRLKYYASTALLVALLSLELYAKKNLQKSKINIIFVMQAIACFNVCLTKLE